MKTTAIEVGMVMTFRQKMRVLGGIDGGKRFAYLLDGLFLEG